MVEEINEIWICPDVHCRDFYKPLLDIKDSHIIFLGDYMDPYEQDGTNNEEGIANLEEIFDFARWNDKVTLLTGNHDESFLWSYMGFERTKYKYYNELHRLYRDNVDLLKPCCKINNVLFSHAGVSKDWIDEINLKLEQSKSDFRLNWNNIEDYINDEFFKELESDKALGGLWDSHLDSSIFNIGAFRGGWDLYGGPFWCDIREYNDPDNFGIQIFGHTQLEKTGNFITKGNGTCLDSRSLFLYDFKSNMFTTPFLNEKEENKNR